MSILTDMLTAIGTALEASAEQRNADSVGLQIDADSIGQLIRLARIEREMSLRTLSQLTGISDLKLEWYERKGETFWKPSFDEIVDIKKALGISADSVKKFL